MLRTKSNLDATWAGQKVANSTQASTTFSRTFFGITIHAVFMDYHFANYNRIVAVTYTDAKGVEKFLPMTRETGQPELYQSGFLWVKCAFRVGSPPYNQGAVEKGVRDFTAFWAVKNGVNLDSCRFNVKVKRIAIAMGWQPNFLQEHMAAPWQDAGVVEWKNKQFTSYLKPITSF